MKHCVKIYHEHLHAFNLLLYMLLFLRKQIMKFQILLAYT